MNNYMVLLYFILLVEGVYFGYIYYFDNDMYICGFDVFFVGVKYWINVDWVDIVRDFFGDRLVFIVIIVK